MSVELFHSERDWHTASVERCASRLQSDLSVGLTTAQVAQRQSQYGPNRLAEFRQKSAWHILFDQFKSLIVGLLIVAAAVALGLGEPMEAAAIAMVVLLNSLIGFFTEWRADRALAALRQTVVPLAHVVREGCEREISAIDLVPGDLVVLSAGGRVPADGRIAESVGLQLDESALTGESMPVAKVSDVVTDARAPLADRVNMAYMGTNVANGRGRALVTATVAATELARIGELVSKAEAPRTPLEQKLDSLGRILLLMVLSLCSVVILVGWAAGTTSFWKMFEVGVSLAIAAVPEGLPAVATMALAIGMQRMARKGTLVRRLAAVETLGSTTVICTDKTGTLTKNEMTATVVVINGRRIDITGTGYQPTGEFQENGIRIDPSHDGALSLIFQIAALCNDATIDRREGAHRVLGDPTEAALVVAAEKAGQQISQLRDQFVRRKEIPFDSHAKRMTTVHETPTGETMAFVKGSPGTILRLCDFQETNDGTISLTEEERQHWEQVNRDLAASALRVLGLAYRRPPQGYHEPDWERSLIFVGLIGMIDPLRDEAKDAIAECREAGIRTIMITGDQPATAAEIARQLGMQTDRQENSLRVVHGRELAELDAAGWRAVTNEAAVFARVAPADKLRIIECLQQQGHIVAMTGDGINDAPALKKADIGIAMGMKGTEVAKESADLVITDDNFATIVSAVEQGRIIYANILRFIHYLLSCNLAEVLTIFAALIIGWPLPLGALQLLWLNMITDVFPALALALEPSSPDAMKRLPRPPHQGVLGPQFIGLILWQGALLATATLVAFGLGLKLYADEHTSAAPTTMAFSTLSLVQVFHVFRVRSRIRSAFGDRLFANGWLWSAVVGCTGLQLAAVFWSPLQALLHTEPLDALGWLVVVACAAAPLAVIEAIKLVQRRGSDS